MRDKRFVSHHRGGPLGQEQHFQLIEWAYECSYHVLHLFGEKIDDRLLNALAAAKMWWKGKASVGAARAAAVEAHRVARECENPTSTAVARSVGHAVATAHMADHALEAAWYALKALKSAGFALDAEREWQNGQLPPEIKELVLSVRKNRKV
jgi:hypothetical protein